MTKSGAGEAHNAEIMPSFGSSLSPPRGKGEEVCKGFHRKGLLFPPSARGCRRGPQRLPVWARFPQFIVMQRPARTADLRTASRRGRPSARPRGDPRSPLCSKRAFPSPPRCGLLACSDSRWMKYHVIRGMKRISSRREQAVSGRYHTVMTPEGSLGQPDHVRHPVALPLYKLAALELVQETGHLRLGELPGGH